MEQYFSLPIIEKHEFPPYYTFYTPKDAIFIVEYMKFEALFEERRKEVSKDNFDQTKIDT